MQWLRYCDSLARHATSLRRTGVALVSCGRKEVAQRSQRSRSCVTTAALAQQTNLHVGKNLDGWTPLQTIFDCCNVRPILVNYT